MFGTRGKKHFALSQSQNINKNNNKCDVMTRSNAYLYMKYASIYAWLFIAVWRTVENHQDLICISARKYGCCCTHIFISFDKTIFNILIAKMSTKAPRTVERCFLHLTTRLPFPMNGWAIGCIPRAQHSFWVGRAPSLMKPHGIGDKGNVKLLTAGIWIS